MVMPKIAVIGAGAVGSTTAFLLARKGALGEIMLLDLKRETAFGQALDIRQSLIDSETEITPAGNYKDISGADIAIITAGRPRASDMSRLDLMNSNKEIVVGIARNIAKYAPESSIITVTNPVDVMNYVAWRASGFDRRRSVGNGSNLDTMRLKAILSKRYNAKSSEINVMTIGEHGPNQIPVFSRARIKGKAVRLGERDMGRLRRDVLLSADRIIEAKGSTQYAPASSVAELVMAMVGRTKRPFPCSAVLSGEYGYSDISIGVPVTFKNRRVDKIIELKMGTYEDKVFREGADKLKNICIGLRV